MVFQNVGPERYRLVLRALPGVEAVNIFRILLKTVVTVFIQCIKRNDECTAQPDRKTHNIYYLGLPFSDKPLKTNKR